MKQLLRRQVKKKLSLYLAFRARKRVIFLLTLRHALIFNRALSGIGPRCHRVYQQRMAERVVDERGDLSDGVAVKFHQVQLDLSLVHI